MRITKKQKKLSNIDTKKIYEYKEALDILRDNASSKFDETVEISIRLGIDVTKADQNIRGMLTLPNGTGKTIKVAVFTESMKSDAEKAGADVIGAEDLIEKVNSGNIDFDRAIATPDIMPKMAKIARILGSKGLMPNPKLGTVTNNISEAVKNAKSGQIEYRAEKKGIVHAGVGKLSFTDDKIIENINALIDQLKKIKPSTSKGQYLISCSISTTQGIGLKVNTK